MFQALIGPIADLAGSFMQGQIEKQKAKAKVTQTQAEAEAERIGCKGYHTHTQDGKTLYMPCETHADAVVKVDEYTKTGKKKRKKKYKTIEYVNYARQQAMLKYSWNDCMKDQIKQYGNKEIASKVCSAIKNKTVKR